MSGWGRIYWPVWMGAVLATFLLGEITALVQGGTPDATLSSWVWNALKIARNQGMSNWSAADFLIFGGWVVMVTWLTAHFFFRRFT